MSDTWEMTTRERLTLAINQRDFWRENFIEQKDTIAELEEANRWRDVNEELPDKSGMYLVRFYWDNGIFLINASYNHKYKCFNFKVVDEENGYDDSIVSFSLRKDQKFEKKFRGKKTMYAITHWRIVEDWKPPQAPQKPTEEEDK